MSSKDTQKKTEFPSDLVYAIGALAADSSVGALVLTASGAITSSNKAIEKTANLINHVLSKLLDGKHIAICESISSDGDSPARDDKTKANTRQNRYVSFTETKDTDKAVVDNKMQEIMDHLLKGVKSEVDSFEKVSTVNKWKLDKAKKEYIALQNSYSKFHKIWENHKKSYDCSEIPELKEKIRNLEEQLKTAEELAESSQMLTHQMEQNQQKKDSFEEKYNAVKKEREEAKSKLEALEKTQASNKEEVERLKKELTEAENRVAVMQRQTDITEIFRTGSKKRQRLETAYSEKVVAATKDAIEAAKNKATSEFASLALTAVNAMNAVREKIDEAASSMQAEDARKNGFKELVQNRLEEIKGMANTFKPDASCAGLVGSIENIGSSIERARTNYIQQVVSGEDDGLLN